MDRRVFLTSMLSPVLGLGCSAHGQVATPSPPPAERASDPESIARALEAMKRATRFMTETVAYEGAYLWAYLPDFSRCWGELEARRSMLWVQPPGTPSVGHV